MISKSIFIPEMIKHWTERLDNVPSPALIQAWEQLCDAFEQYTVSQWQEKKRSRWTVLQPPTGSGKTQGTILYAAMFSRYPIQFHPGILIVTRRIEEADKIAQQINDLADKFRSDSEETYPVAISYHSDNRKNILPEDLSEHSALIITHRAYELALDFLGPNSTIESTWSLYNNFKGNDRRLIIIDEAIDLVETCSISRDQLGVIDGLINPEIREHFPAEAKCIKSLIKVIDEAAAQDAKGELCKESIVKEHSFSSLNNNMDFNGLRRLLRKQRLDKVLSAKGRIDHTFNKNIQEMVDTVFQELVILHKSWIYYSRSYGTHTLYTARLIVPPGARGAIVLDATASANTIYELFDGADPVKPPVGTRNYTNVTINVKRARSTGKHPLTKVAKEACPDLILDLNERLKGRKVFIVTHKNVEPVLLQYQPDAMFEMKVGHWGNLDGSNEWQDCDAVVIFGMPYRPDHWTAEIFMAFKGVQTDEWLNNPEARSYGKHPDIRRALRMGQLTTDVVQAINRIRCRRVIDGHGNCNSADVYLLLPCNKDGKEVLRGIRKEMPGVRCKEWSLQCASVSQAGRKKGKTPRRSGYGKSLLSYLANENFEKVLASDVRSTLSIPNRTFTRLIQPIKEGDVSCQLAQEMNDLGVAYEIERRGRSNVAYFTKAA